MPPLPKGEALAIPPQGFGKPPDPSAAKVEEFRRILGLRVEERGLQNRGREHDFFWDSDCE